MLFYSLTELYDLIEDVNTLYFHNFCYCNEFQKHSNLFENDLPCTSRSFASLCTLTNNLATSGFHRIDIKCVRTLVVAYFIQ